MARGFPDFTTIMRPGRPTAPLDQMGMQYVLTQVVPGLSNVTVPMFTVGPGEQFLMSFGNIECHTNTWQEFELSYLGVVALRGAFLYNHMLVDSPISATLWIAGDTMDITLYNYNAVAQTFWVTVGGNLEPLM